MTPMRVDVGDHEIGADPMNPRHPRSIFHKGPEGVELSKNAPASRSPASMC